MCPDSSADVSRQVLILRGRKALESYLAGYPSTRTITAGMALLDAAAWKKEAPDADEAAWSIATRWDLPILPALDFEPDPDAMSQLTSDTVRRLRAIPLIIRNRLIAVALEDAGDSKVIEELNFLTAHRVVPVVVTANVIREGIARHYDRIEDASIAVELGLDLKADSAETSEREAKRLAEEQPVVRLVANMIAEAVKRRASDIHLRPGEQGTEILYRIDGEMVAVRHVEIAMAWDRSILRTRDRHAAEHDRQLIARQLCALLAELAAKASDRREVDER